MEGFLIGVVNVRIYQVIHYFKLVVSFGLCLVATDGQGLDRFKNSVVEVAVGKGTERSPEIGTGFVVSVDGDKFSILTARHLFYAGRDKFLDDITVTLFADKLHPHRAVWLTDSPALDLAVLDVSGVSPSVSRDVPSLPLRPGSEHVGIGETLYVFGGQSQARQVPTVSISDTEDGDRPNGVRFTGIGIRGGFSGSAILDANGRLAAVHLGTVETDANFGHAQLMANAYEALSRLGVTMNKLAMGTVASGANVKSPAAVCVKPPSGLVGWWPGDGDAKDIAGGSNPSAMKAVRFSDGKVQEGFAFGQGGYIAIPASPHLANEQFTWTAWVRPDGPGPRNDQAGTAILGQVVDGHTVTLQLLWRATDSRFVFFFGDPRSEKILSADSFAPGAFYLVTGTYDGSMFRLFVNGFLEGSVGAIKKIDYSPSTPWAFGQGGLFAVETQYARTWNGVIDEVQAFKRALSQSEIQSIFNAGSAGQCKPNGIH